MTIQILQSNSQIAQARQELKRRGLSCLGPRWLRVLRDRGWVSGVNVGDFVKSWDVLQTARFAEQYLNEQDPVLDLGVYASEILCILRRMGYSQLSGVDLNPRLKSMPQADVVRYEVCDFMATPFPDASFKLITAISVIEHGFDGRRLLAEVSRLLLPGGFFVASFDYWPDKISTDGIRMFDMDWTIFSEPEIRSFLREAAVYGLAPQGNTDLTARERPIHCAERDYTFAWLVLRKD